MPAPPTAAVAQTNRPDPQPDRPDAGADAPTRTGLLVGLVRKLIDYGKGLASALQQHVAGTPLPEAADYFSPGNVALILAQITRGLLRAAALHAWLLTRGDRPARPTPSSVPPPRKPRPRRPARRPQDLASLLAHPPTPEESAAEVRRRPIGATLADICRDLGMVPGNPLWRELQSPIVSNCGNLAILVNDTLDRMFDKRAIEQRAFGQILQSPALSDAVWNTPFWRLPAPLGTGPP
jgi:hypothetical protein